MLFSFMHSAIYVRTTQLCAYSTTYSTYMRTVQLCMHIF